ncbi:hypothetical protein WAI453_012692 [Rhynchosporium graminicola]
MICIGCKENAIYYLKVKAVELTSPKHSKQDAEILHSRLVNSQIFAAFSFQDREGIWSELSKIAGLVTLFFSFFADINYLHARAYDGNAYSQPTAIDPRRGTFIDLQNIIADGLASTSRGPATEDLEALVHSYRDLISTAHVNTTGDRHEHH